MIDREGASFSAGQDAGTRLSACLARMAALQLVEEARWWNWRRRRLMARALVACADELDEQADATRADWTAGWKAEEPTPGPTPTPVARQALLRLAR